MLNPYVNCPQCGERYQIFSHYVGDQGVCEQCRISTRCPTWVAEANKDNNKRIE